MGRRTRKRDRRNIQRGNEPGHPSLAVKEKKPEDWSALRYVGGIDASGGAYIKTVRVRETQKQLLIYTSESELSYRKQLAAFWREGDGSIKNDNHLHHKLSKTPEAALHVLHQQLQYDVDAARSRLNRALGDLYKCPEDVSEAKLLPPRKL